MIPQKDGGQVGQTISHYPALRDPARRDKILEKLGEVPTSPTSVCPSRFLDSAHKAGFWKAERVAVMLRIPPSLGGSCSAVVR